MTNSSHVKGEAGEHRSMGLLRVWPPLCSMCWTCCTDCWRARSGSSGEASREGPSRHDMSHVEAQVVCVPDDSCAEPRAAWRVQSWWSWQSVVTLLREICQCACSLTVHSSLGPKYTASCSVLWSIPLFSLARAGEGRGCKGGLRARATAATHHKLQSPY